MSWRAHRGRSDHRRSCCRRSATRAADWCAAVMQSAAAAQNGARTRVREELKEHRSRDCEQLLTSGLGLRCAVICRALIPERMSSRRRHRERRVPSRRNLVGPNFIHTL